MLSLLADRVFRHLFLAQGISLLGTGFVTISLALLAFELAGSQAGTVLGTALAIRILAYIIGAPLGSVIASYAPRKGFLIGLDLIRAVIICFLPFVTAVWQIYILVLVLQFASAAFTPAFQAVIPDIIPDERRYMRALSMSRLAADMETIVSPIVAALLLSFVSFHMLFVGTVVGFLTSALLIASVSLPSLATRVEGRGVLDAATRGIKIFLGTPRLQGYLSLKMAVAAASAMVLVNTVVIVQSRFGLAEYAVAIAMTFYGCGALIGALLIPRLLDRFSDRHVLLASTGVLSVALAAGSLVGSYQTLLPVWTMIGMGGALINTPIGLLLTRSSAPHDRPSLFSANFTLSHACWLVTYPLAGWLASFIGLSGTFLTLSGVTLFALLGGLMIWPSQDVQVLDHDHPDLEPDHPHLREYAAASAPHRHVYYIDDIHPRWPRPIAA